MSVVCSLRPQFVSDQHERRAPCHHRTFLSAPVNTDSVAVPGDSGALGKWREGTRVLRGTVARLPGWWGIDRPVIRGRRQLCDARRDDGDVEAGAHALGMALRMRNADPAGQPAWPQGHLKRLEPTAGQNGHAHRARWSRQGRLNVEGVMGHLPLERVAAHAVAARERLFPPKTSGSPSASSL